jgi:hypothetical protein
MGRPGLMLAVNSPNHIVADRFRYWAMDCWPVCNFCGDD